MIKNYLKTLLLCFSILWAVNSCTNNEEIQTPVSEIRQFENTFSPEHFNDAFIKDNLIIEWDDFNIKQDRENNNSIYEFNTSLKVKNTIENGQQTLAFTYKLLAFRDSDGNGTFELIKFLSGSPGVLNTVSYFDPAAFSGTLYHYNLKGETVKIKAYKDGVLINEFTDEKTGVINAQSKAPEVLGCEEGCYVLVFTRHYTDYYLSINGGMFTYGYSVYEGTTSEWVWVSGNGGGGYGNPGDGNYHYHFDYPHGPNIGSNNHPEEIIIDASFSNLNKINCTYQQLLKNTTIKELLDNFFGEDADYDLIFEVVTNLDCSSDGDIDQGCTTDNLESNGSITIKIDQAYINSDQTPTLFLAHTIIHEAIHANLYLALYNHNNGSTVNLPDINDFPAIYEQYRQMKGWQHEFMANHYVSLMAQTLQEVHPLLNDQAFINILSNNYSDLSLQEFYTSIAYLGLDETTGQTNYLSNQENSDNYNISFYAAQANATKTPNCD